VVDVKLLATAPAPEHFPDPVGMEIAFAGRSNVGKSTLLNALVGRHRLARTSSTPGCTRMISFYEARTADGAVLRLVDLPGYGYAKRSRVERVAWGQLVEGYLLGRPTLAAVVTLVDVRRGVEDDDRDLLSVGSLPAEVKRPPVQALLVATKLDKLPRARHKPALRKLREQAGCPVVGFSAKDPATAVELWATLRRQLGLDARA
jgi:GTP-binding protein